MPKRASQIRFGVVTAWPDEDWHSQRLLLACSRLGAATMLDPSALALVVDGERVEVRFGGEPARDFDAFLLARGLGRRGDADVQFEGYRALEGMGAMVANRIDPLLSAQDKLRTSWLLRRAGVPTPRSGAAQTPEAALDLLESLGEGVVKPVTGSLGEGVERIRPDRTGRRILEDRLERDGAVYLQEYVPNPGRDVRLFVVGERVAAAVVRQAPPGEWRTNVECGADVRPLPADRPLGSIGLRAARAIGLDWAGVDVALGPDGPTVLEVNGTPGWQGILKATGLDMADSIAEHLADRVMRRAGQKRWMASYQ